MSVAELSNDVCEIQTYLVKQALVAGSRLQTIDNLGCVLSMETTLFHKFFTLSSVCRFCDECTQTSMKFFGRDDGLAVLLELLFDQGTKAIANLVEEGFLVHLY
jgi:hypothetical protein